MYICLYFIFIGVYLFTVKKYLSRDIITKMYPLHEPEDLKKLGADWYQIKRIFKEQPIGVYKIITYK